MTAPNRTKSIVVENTIITTVVLKTGAVRNSF